MMRSILALIAIVLAASPATAQIPSGPGATYVTPPRPMATIEFVQEAGIERWQVRLTGGQHAADTAYLRITGNSCTHMDEVYKGMITPLYEDMTFKTKTGRTCTVTAIER